MLPDPASLIDPVALGIVLGGTSFAGLIKVGWRDCVCALKVSLGLVQGPLDHQANRIALARWVSALTKAGVRKADADMPPDPALASAVNAAIRSGSLRAMRDTYEKHQATRRSATTRAAFVFDQMGELAPIFGLVGTLFAVTQMVSPHTMDGAAASFGAISAAVLSTLYGVLFAHLFCFPTAQAIRRKCEREEKARDALIDWLERETAGFMPSAQASRPVTLQSAA